MLTTIIVFIIVLSLLVFVHEFGHFWTARKFGVKAEEFGFGFPPRAIGVYKNLAGKWAQVRGSKEVDDAQDTIFSLNWIPLGGFVKIKGEDGEMKDEDDSFASHKIWQRAIILAAGVTMNIMLAALLFSVGYIVGLPQAVEDAGPGAVVTSQNVQIVEVMPGSPAETAELQAGDIIKRVDNQVLRTTEELQNYLKGKEGQQMEFILNSKGNEITKTLSPVWREDIGQVGVGIAIIESGLVRYPVHLAVWHGIKLTIFYTWFIIVAFYGMIKGLILGQGLGLDIGGPVRIAQITGDAARMGFVYLLNFSALLSINLAIINGFPFPALDGGRILFLFIEKIKGSPVKQKTESIIHNTGFALLMLLVLLVTYKDIIRLFK